MKKQTTNKSRQGTIVGIVGITCNLLLAAAKITLGALSGLISLVADGVNNLSDCGSVTVSLVALRISEKPADEEHPYGHQRAEYIASMAISFLILMLAFELLRESVESLIAHTSRSGNLGVYILVVASIAVKGGMFFFYRIMAKRLSSDSLRASALDSACDCLATLAVAVGLILSAYGIFADGYVGLFVALFIGWEGLSILRDASSKLLGNAPDPKLTEQIRSIISCGQNVLGFHDLKLYKYGPNKFYAVVHVEMDESLSAVQTHAHIDEIERTVFSETGVELTAHLDPVNLADSEARHAELQIREKISLLGQIDLHDFRLERGENTTAIFELGVPFSCKLSDEEIARKAQNIVRELGYDPKFTVERK